MRKFLFLFCLAFLVLVQPNSICRATETLPKELEGIGIDPNLGTQLSLETELFDEDGKTVKLASYFDGKKPVILIMAYYGCPMLCGVMLNAARESLVQFPWQMGDQYRVITISIDPKETYELAVQKKASILEEWPASSKKGAEENWHFLTAKKENSEKLAKEIGFKYKYVKADDQYAHSPGLFFISPKGVLSRVLFGIEYSQKNLKLALLEAGEGKIGNLAEKILMFCYHYDPKENKYTMFATRVMKAGGGLTVFLILMAYMTMFFRGRSLRRKG